MSDYDDNLSTEAAKPTPESEAAQSPRGGEPRAPQTGAGAKALRKAEKKAAKKLRRERHKAAYQALSTPRKVLYWVIRVAACLAALAIVGLAGYSAFSAAFSSYYANKISESLEATASREDILKEAPPDTAGEARVAATEAYSADDTWVIYMYICGSNLESLGRNELSDVTSYYIGLESATSQAAEGEAGLIRFHTFVEEMRQQGVSLPNYMFLPVAHSDYEDASDSDGDNGEEGYATKNLRDMFTVELPENVSVVIQTGGANNWSLSNVNPNAAQRFVYNSDGFTEVSSAYPQNMGSAETFGDFLGFCQEQYPADHQMLLLWNHGSGPFGFCNDEMFSGDGVTLAEMSSALEAVYGEQPEQPPFELVGFDACLMASSEVAEGLHGYARYLVASEETEAGDGWAYSEWLGELAQHPEMNGARLGKAIADSFVEACANFSVNLKWLGVEKVATMSVVDVDKAHAAYEAYGKLAAAALTDASGNPWPLAALGRAAEKSIRYAGSYYKYFNTLDLGVFMDNLSGDYPAETAEVLSALDDAVLYHRETSYTLGSRGLSIYFPTDVDSLYGLTKYLEYIDDICENDDIRALYYYKIAGCLNPELQAYMSEAGYGELPPLDFTPMRELALINPDVNPDNSVEMFVSNEVSALVQNISVHIARYNADEDSMRFYGEDECYYLDEYRNLRTTFDGSWVMLDGHPLSLEIIDRTDEYIRYRSAIQYNDTRNAGLVLARDLASGEFSILGVQAMQEDADTLGRNLEPLSIGDRIAPCYRTENMATERIDEEYGREFKYTANSELTAGALEDGEYYMVLSFTDTRGDEYYPSLVSFRISGGKLAGMAVSDEFSAQQSAE